MANGGRKFGAMHTAHRYREINCASCGEAFLAYGQRKMCPPCKKADRLSRRNAQKHAAQRAVKDAVRTGALVRQPCIRCTEEGRKQRGTSHGHHEDYSKPLEVIWLCPFHHVKRHEELAAGTGRYFNCRAA